ILDSSSPLPSRSIISKALWKLSGRCGLHPSCYTLAGVQRIGQQVAGGGFGDVWKGRIGGQIVAVKSMRYFLEEDTKASLKAEAVIWRQLSHPNLLPFFGLYMLDKRLCLVSPWMENGDLNSFLRRSSSDIDCSWLIIDVAAGLEYLHSECVVHGDLKPANILVTPSGSACITDFGLSRVVNDLNITDSSTTSGRAGTVRYQAPEVLRNGSKHFGSDVYAFAGVGYEILTGNMPFSEIHHEPAIILKVMEGNRPSWPPLILPHTRQLLDSCWHQDPEMRPTMAEILPHLSGASRRRSQHRSEWDVEEIRKFRCSVEEWPLAPSALEITQRFSRSHITGHKNSNMHPTANGLANHNAGTSRNAEKELPPLPSLSHACQGNPLPTPLRSVPIPSHL
ncbi:kinase-like domain-containing protein, partial [Mycena vitilis]